MISVLGKVWKPFGVIPRNLKAKKFTYFIFNPVRINSSFENRSITLFIYIKYVKYIVISLPEMQK